jgi:hypothetical protein
LQGPWALGCPGEMGGRAIYDVDHTGCVGHCRGLVKILVAADLVRTVAVARRSTTS